MSRLEQEKLANAWKACFLEVKWLFMEKDLELVAFFGFCFAVNFKIEDKLSQFFRANQFKYCSSLLSICSSWVLTAWFHSLD